MNCKGCPPSTLSHSLKIKTYCLPTRVPSTNTIQTETVVLHICDAILENAEHNKLTAIVCLDFGAAFDTVNHSILETVIEHYFGFYYTALQWLSSYISNRLFSVKIGGSFSHAHTINFSVPQGRDPRSSPLQLLC